MLSLMMPSAPQDFALWNVPAGTLQLCNKQWSNDHCSDAHWNMNQPQAAKAAMKMMAKAAAVLLTTLTTMMSV
jgi:hypothetical protein